jgi:energy-coupling factor transport system ATP-binding protein
MSITLKNISYVYMADSPYQTMALTDVTLEVPKGSITAIIGHTGSGKSTLVQIMNGLLKPTNGKINVDGENILDKKYDLKKLRFKVGLVFQYPEHQLFEETVYKDIAYGPKNMKLSEEEIDKRVRRACDMIGLDKELLNKSPFELSGGQKRRVAIAGIIAMEPQYIIFDEPAAGLDPVGRNEILNMIYELKNTYGVTVIIVSHSMEDVGKIADKVVVLNKSKVIFNDTPKNVFKHIDELEKMGLAVPQVTYLMRKLKDRGFHVNDNVITVEEAKNEILKLFNIFNSI